MTEHYIVILACIEGNPQDGYRTVYYSDGHPFAGKSGAVRHGFEAGRSDDFNIGVIKGGKLASLWWMGKQHDMDAETLARIGREIGLEG